MYKSEGKNRDFHINGALVWKQIIYSIGMLSLSQRIFNTGKMISSIMLFNIYGTKKKSNKSDSYPLNHKCANRKHLIDTYFQLYSIRNMIFNFTTLTEEKKMLFVPTL